MKKTLFIFTWVFCLLLCENVFSQTIAVRGKITDGNEPLAGVSVRVKDAATGTSTNANGIFSINAPADAVLVVTYIGFTTKEVPVNGRTDILITLQAQNTELQDVVVLGYQTATKKSVTTSVAHVEAKDINSYVTGNVANALQGKVPGVQIISGGGAQGAQPRILIHGLSSINYNNNPLVIVDGVEVDFNSFNFLNPADIASIDVLEDASAAAIYGARGGQGVIIVTTKRGKGKATINVTASTGWDHLPDVNLASAAEYTRVMNQEARASGQTIPFPDSSSMAGTDYWDQTFDVGRTQNYVVSAQSGKEGLSLYGSLGYYRTDSYNATDKGGNWQRFTGRFNADMDISKVVKMGLNVAPRYERSLAAPNTIYGAYVMDPTTAPFKSVDSLYRSMPADFMDMTAFNPVYSLPNRSPFSSSTNPAFSYITNFNEHDYLGLQDAVYLQVTPVKDLVLKSSLETSLELTQANNYTPKYYLASNSYNAQDSLNSSTVYTTRWKIVNTAEYKFNIEQHHFDVLAGQSADKYVRKGTIATREGIPLDDPSFQHIPAAATVIGGGGYYQPGESTASAPWGNMLSFFGSLRYNFRDRYFLSGTMRADASSLVNPDYRWGYFPTLSGAWVVSDEPFFKNLTNTVNYLKVRASWGKSGGNLPTWVGSYLTTIAPTTYPDATGGYVTGYAAGTIANPLIKWEVQQDYTFGLEANLLKDKLSFSAEKYVRNPNSLLENITVDYVLGYPQGYYPTQLANIGKMTTNGWDFSIGYRDHLSEKLRFGANLTLSHFKSIVDDLGTADPILGHENNDVISTFRSRLTKGHEPGAWYGYIVDGVFQTDEEAVNYVNANGVRLQPSAQAGDLKFRDINGDGVLDNDDLTDLGSPWPKLTGNFTLTVNYGNFDFRTEFYGSWGAEYFQNYRLNMNPTGHQNFESGQADKFWHGPGTSNSFPILRYPDQNGNFSKMSTFFLDKADFVKCNLMQIGYTFPSAMIKGVHGLRISASAQNLFIITKYSGLNPDLPWYNTPGYNGVDNYQVPSLKTFLLGLSFNL